MSARRLPKLYLRGRLGCTVPLLVFLTATAALAVLL